VRAAEIRDEGEGRSRQSKRGGEKEWKRRGEHKKRGERRMRYKDRCRENLIERKMDADDGKDE
jgi:hypothetical protein